MSIEKNKALATEFVTKLTAETAQQAFDMMTDDCTWMCTGYNMAGWLDKDRAMNERKRPCDKETFIYNLLKNGVTAHPGRSKEGLFKTPLTFKILRTVGEANKVGIELQGNATLKNGESYDNMYCLWLYFNDAEKIERIVEYNDIMYSFTVFEGK